MLIFVLICGILHSSAALPIENERPLTVDEVITNRTAASEDGTLIDGQFILHGKDILMTKSQYRDMLNGEGRKHEVKGHGAPRQMLWRGGVIPYEFDASLRGDRNLVIKAMKEWESATCIRFRQATSQDRYRVRIAGGKGCNSYIGVLPNGAQPLNLEYPGCWEHKIILHELGHAIGLHHEMNHPNAAKYIDVQWNNIQPDCRSQYQTQPGQSSTYGFDYDMLSVMHYGPYSCSTQPGKLLAMKAKDPSKQSLIGSATKLSQMDTQIVNKMYQGICGTGGTGGTGGNTCQDRMAPCYPHYCGNIQYAMQNCPRTCGRCGGGVGFCADSNPQSCAYWARMGMCMRDPAYMSQACRRTCGFCR